MTWQFWAMMLGAFAVGGALSRWLHFLIPERPTFRIVALAIFPLFLFVAVTLILAGLPRGEDWGWLFLGMFMLSPIWIAWLAGMAIDALVRRARAPVD